jgi:hypothetical protein
MFGRSTREGGAQMSHHIKGEAKKAATKKSSKKSSKK